VLNVATRSCGSKSSVKWLWSTKGSQWAHCTKHNVDKHNETPILDSQRFAEGFARSSDKGVGLCYHSVVTTLSKLKLPTYMSVQGNAKLLSHQKCVVACRMSHFACSVVVAAIAAIMYPAATN
jgi:hypothetical protein